MNNPCKRLPPRRDLTARVALLLGAVYVAGCGARQPVEYVEPEDVLRVIVSGPDSVLAGEPVTARVDIAPARGWSLTDGHPARVVVHAPSEQVVSAAAAPRYDRSGAAFLIDTVFEAPGPDALRATLHASVCDATRCIGLQRLVEWQVQVE